MLFFNAIFSIFFALKKCMRYQDSNTKKMGTISLLRRRSRINTDWFPKRAPKKDASRGVWGMLPQKFFLDFNSQKSFESFRQDIYCLPKLYDRFQRGKFFGLIKNILLRKIWPISIKQWKSVWIHAWCYSLKDFTNS